MIGTIDFSKKRADVIGAGIAGLLMAYRLDQLGLEVTLWERSGRAGGLIETQCLPQGPVEKAAHSLLVSPAVEKLFQELQVSLSPIRDRSRYILRDEKFRRFPLSVCEALGMVARLLWTLELWARWHLGPAAHDYLLQPMIQGIYGCSTSELLIRSVFPALWVPPGKRALLHWWKSGLFKNRVKKKLMAPTQGMQSLVDALSAHLKDRLGPRFRLGQELRRLEEIPAHDQTNLILCVPSQEAASLLEGAVPDLGLALAQAPYSELTSVTVFAARSELGRFQPGVGVLIPKVENYGPCLGALTNSSAFENRVTEGSGLESFTLFFKRFAPGDSETALRKLYGWSGGTLFLQETHWKRAIPVYGKDLKYVWECAAQGWCANPGQVLFGNYTGQVSIRGMIETIFRIQKTKTP